MDKHTINDNNYYLSLSKVVFNNQQSMIVEISHNGLKFDLVLSLVKIILEYIPDHLE